MQNVMTRTSQPSRYFWFWLLKRPWWNHGGVFMLGLLLARAVLMGELYPFGTGYLAAICLSYPRLGPAALVGVIVGTLLSLNGWMLLVYLSCFLVVYIVLLRAPGISRHWFAVPGLIAAVHLLIRGIGILINGNELYYWIGLVFESFFACVLTLVAMTAVLAFPKAWRGHLLTAEDRTSLGLVVLGALVGISQSSFYGLGLQSIISRWLVLWASLIAGPGGGAAFGVAVGLVPSIQGTLTTGPIAFYALSGLLGGVFNSFRKVGVSIGFTLAMLMLSIFFSEQMVIVQSMKETSVAILFFFLIQVPIKWKDRVMTDVEGQREDKLMIVARLKRISKLIGELDQSFIQPKLTSKDQDEMSTIFNEVSMQVCNGCSLYRVCWEQEFYKTYRSMVEACSKLEDKVMIGEKDFGVELKRRCTRLRELGGALNARLELHRVKNTYDQQIAGCHSLLTTQLKGLSLLVDSFSEELAKKALTNKDMEDYIQQTLVQKGIVPERIEVEELNSGEFNIVIRQVACTDGNWCRGMVAPNISQTIGKTFVVGTRECPRSKNQRYCRYCLTPSQTIDVKIGSAQCPKEGAQISGDICTTIGLPDYRLVLVMSDGMGAGKEAYTESAAALGLLEKLLLGGFSVDIAIKTVNTVLFLRSGRDSFVTLDVVLINQISGQAEFLKIGGAPTLIYSRHGVKVIKASTPPVGIIENLELQTIRQVVGPEQSIIMMSDGVWEAMHASGGPHGWLEDVLQKMSLDNPEQVAKYLLFLAKKACGNRARDDMCIQVARIGGQEIA